MGYRKPSKLHAIPQTTLEHKVKKAREKELSLKKAAKKRLAKFKTVFSEAQENELVDYILYLEERLFGLSLTDLRKLAFDLAGKNHIPHLFNEDNKMADKHWLYGFLMRHPQLALRNPEKTSLARAKGFIRAAVKKVFDLLKSLNTQHNSSPNDIYNVDQIGIMTVPNKPSRILALCGKKQVGCLFSAEQGVLVTLETCMNAAGNFMPGMFVFPHKKANPLLLDSAPPGSSAVYYETGWITKENFIV
ncbi:uncharacterized protein [Diabrotica undecimpunctata]|uniref:uncharacterized protein n=1 Tax=Diabrotica undecimpunctata TaxID=50387 RepID=UPI003B63565F